jgi:hypothetical protein
VPLLVGGRALIPGTYRGAALVGLRNALCEVDQRHQPAASSRPRALVNPNRKNAPLRGDRVNQRAEGDGDEEVGAPVGGRGTLIACPRIRRGIDLGDHQRSALTSVLSVAVFAFFPPSVGALGTAESRNLVALGVFLVSAIVVAELAARSRRAAARCEYQPAGIRDCGGPGRHGAEKSAFLSHGHRCSAG